MTRKYACVPDTTLFLSSSHGRGNSHDFTVDYSSPINLNKNGANYIKLQEISMTYSWFNIDTAYNNTMIKYSPDNGTTVKDITFPSGSYSYKDINDNIESTLEKLGDDPDAIKLIFDSVEMRCAFILKTGYQVTMVGKFGELIGFDKLTPYTVTSKSEKLPNITRSVDAIQIRCSITSSNVNGYMSDVIYQFSTQDLINSYPFTKKPTDIGELYGICNTTDISNIRIRITDQLGRLINLNNQEVALTLSIRECDG